MRKKLALFFLYFKYIKVLMFEEKRMLKLASCLLTWPVWQIFWVHSSCYNGIAQIGGLAYEQLKFLSHSSEGWEVRIKALIDSVSDEGLFLAHRWLFLCRQQQENSPGSLIRALSPFIRATPYGLIMPQRPGLQIPSQWELGFNILIWERTQPLSVETDNKFSYLESFYIHFGWFTPISFSMTNINTFSVLCFHFISYKLWFYL